MRVTAVREVGRRDRFYVTLDDGASVSWEMTSYGDRLPHDLVHLVAEAAAGWRTGVWGRVADGADLGAISRHARGVGGMEGYAALIGDDPVGLAAGEALANAPWWGEVESLVAYFATEKDATVLALDRPHLVEIRERVLALSDAWAALAPKGSLNLEWDGGPNVILSPRA